MCVHFSCSGFARPIGAATMFPRASSSPELKQLSSSRADLSGDFGGVSCRCGWSIFGGALVLGAGGGGALLVLFSALVSDIVMSSSWRCACRSSSFSSCFISRSAAFLSFSLMIFRPSVSSFCVLSISDRKSPRRLFSLCSPCCLCLSAAFSC